MCLLLPYWRTVLRSPMAAVLVWRDPVAVARSLQRRNGTSLPYGVALWERYNRSALANLVGIDTYVLDYDALVEDPASTLSGLTSWLESTSTFDGKQSWDHERALSIVTAEMRHQSVRTREEEGRIVLDEQRQLVDHLTELAGGHEVLPQVRCRESPWTEAMFEARRSSNPLELKQLEESNHQRDWYVAALADTHSDLAAAHSELAAARAELDAAHADLVGATGRVARMQTSSSWRITAPIRSVAAFWEASGKRRLKR